MAKAKAPKKPKKPRTLRQWLEPQLRNIARRWPDKNKARAKAAKRVEDSKFLNGKPKYKTMYECANCAKLVEKSDSHMDHRSPVVDPEVGFVDWNNYVERLFCGVDNFQCLCSLCHATKTKSEGIIRKETRKSKKV